MSTHTNQHPLVAAFFSFWGMFLPETVDLEGTVVQAYNAEQDSVPDSFTTWGVALPLQLPALRVNVNGEVMCIQATPEILEAAKAGDEVKIIKSTLFMWTKQYITDLIPAS